MSKPRQDVRQALPQEPYQSPTKEGPVLCNTADGAGCYQAVEQQGAYDNRDCQYAEQATLYDNGYNAGYLDGYKAACRQHSLRHSWSYADNYDSSGKSPPASTKERRIANYARLIALIVLCCVVATAFLVLLVYQLFLSDQDNNDGSHAGGDVPFPPLVIPKKIPVNDSTASGYQEQASRRLLAQGVQEKRLRMRAPMDFKPAPKHSLGHGGVTPKTTSRSDRNERRSSHKAYKGQPANSTSKPMSTASTSWNRDHLSTATNSFVEGKERDG